MSQLPSVRENIVVVLVKRFRLSKAAVNVILALVAVFWLVPTISLLVISLGPESLFGASGWWTVFTAPAQLTWGNYATIFSQGFAAGGVLDSLVTSLEITIPVTILVALISSLAAYSLVFGSWRGRDMIF